MLGQRILTAFGLVAVLALVLVVLPPVPRGASHSGSCS